jgi:predicted ATPase
MNKVTVSNFKGYAESTSISFSDLTINVGMNSVGKSTAIQSLLLVRQAFDEIKKYGDPLRKEYTIALNGPYDLQLGNYEQISSSGEDSINISIDDCCFIFNQVSDKFSLRFTPSESDFSLPGSPIFSDSFYYINAERIGPRNYQDIHNHLENLCGYHGEFTFDTIEHHLTDTIVEQRRRIGEAFNVSILSKQIEYWMDYIVPGIEFRTNEDVDSRTAKLKIRQTTLDTDFNSPHNFGFGISYILPIIVTGLLASTNSVFIVENPEAHLHPSGQSRIGQFLAQIAFSGVKVIVETHSEHVLNGIRLYSLKNRIDPNRICINYFTIEGKVPRVERIPLNERMDILNWPDGFFDQEEKDLAELRYLRRK